MKRFLCVLIAAIMFFVPLNGLTVQAAYIYGATATWQDAYQWILREYVERNTGDTDMDWVFMLYDIDMDGIPELHLVTWGFYGPVYTFRDAYVMPLGSISGGRFATAEDIPGIITGSYIAWTRYVIDGNALVPNLIGLADVGYFEIDGRDVTEYEFARAFGFLNNDIDESRVQTYSLTEANIQSAISNWQPTQAISPPTAPAPAQPPPTVTINGTPQSFEVPPQIVNDRTMLPLRAIGEALGMEVDFDGATNTAILTTPNAVITHVIRTAEISVNGATQTFDVPSMIAENRTLVPVRMLAEAVGASVDWVQATRTVIITTN